MLGNVWEWTEDCMSWEDDGYWEVESYAGAPPDGSAWLSGYCSRRVLRGGSWFNPPRSLRSANRLQELDWYRNSTIGFRVARTLSSRSWRPQGAARRADERPGEVMMITRLRVPLAPNTAGGGARTGRRKPSEDKVCDDSGIR